MEQNIPPTSLNLVRYFRTLCPHYGADIFLYFFSLSSASTSRKDGMQVGEADRIRVMKGRVKDDENRNTELCVPGTEKRIDNRNFSMS
jgi:hypothetical protein